MEIGRPVYPSELAHFGVKNQKWGIRRYQNPDGTLTAEGRIHYGIGPARKIPYDEQNPIRQAKADVTYAKNYDRQIKPYKKEREKDLKYYAKHQRRKLFEAKNLYEIRKQSLDHDLKATELRWKQINEEGWAREMPLIKERAARYQKLYKEMDQLLATYAVSEGDGVEMSKRAQRDYKKLQKRWAAYGNAVSRYAKSNLVME